MEEHISFIEKKSLEIFSKINSKEIKRENISFNISPLSGISNTIYRITLIPNKKQDQYEIPNIFFKIFGKLSVLCNREVEANISKSLSNYGCSAKIYETDNKTYRVDEFLYGYETINRDHLYKEIILDKIQTILAHYNTVLNVNTYANIMSCQSKKDYFQMLLADDSRFNVVAYLILQFKPFAERSFKNFKKDSETDKDNLTMEFKENLSRLEKYIVNFDKLLYEFCPDKAMLVLSHNDSHCLNILSNKDFSKIMLVDHEYAYFNFFGYDMVNYFYESMFILSDDKHPFYQFLNRDFSFLIQESNFTTYLKFLNISKEKYRHLFSEYKNYEELFELACTKDYYMRLVGVNSLFILLFSLLYFDYDSFKKKNA